MYKTIWQITEETDEANYLTIFTYYHFNKEKNFPSWYFEDGSTYKVKQNVRYKISKTPFNFFRCLVNQYIVKDGGTYYK